MEQTALPLRNRFRGNWYTQICYLCEEIGLTLHVPLPSLLALRRIFSAPELAASSSRCVHCLQRGIARVQDVRGVRHVVCEALQRADGGGSAQKGRGEFLRSLQTQDRRLCREGHGGACASKVCAR